MKIQVTLFLFVLFFSLFHGSVFAAKKSYIVYLGSHFHGVDATEVEFNQATDTHYELLGSHLGSIERAKDAIFYSYNKHINGFAAMLDEEDVEALSNNPRVVSIFLNKGKTLHTTHSWEFLGLANHGKISTHSLWKKARFGEDVIIANLDTGVWPESESFNDDGMGPVPARWKGGCQNNTKEGVPCNRKLVGAKYFNKGYLALAAQNNVTVDSTVYSTRDTQGHGTHTLSTAGGRAVHNVSVNNGFAKGTAIGGSPKARIAMYRVCYEPIDKNACTDADILAAFDEAIHDGVDILGLSLGGDPVDYFEDPICIGAFHAVEKGIPVVCSAGNEGIPYSVSNLPPWIITVAASTMDREFYSSVLIGNGKLFKGHSFTTKALPAKKNYPLISASDANAKGSSSNNSTFCLSGTLDPKKVKGKILVCLRGINGRLEKGDQAKAAGAVGMILANDLTSGNDTVLDNHVLPTTHVTYNDGLSLFQYMKSDACPVASMTPARTYLNTKPAPYMASFSSQGPNNITSEILKPDITAPGFNVLAAFTQYPKAERETMAYKLLSGTSMSCPHISGIVGLLKTLHPDWSPAAIRSAIMTTATTQDNAGETMLNGYLKKGTPFDYGAGHVRPNRVADPGLVYDLNPQDYINFLSGVGYNRTLLNYFTKSQKVDRHFKILNLNYPSITVPNLNDSVTVVRTVKNVGSPGTYVAKVKEPHGVSVSIEPKMIEVKNIGEEKMFKVTFRVRNLDASKDYVFGALTWSDGSHHVRSPIVVKTHIILERCR